MKTTLLITGITFLGSVVFGQEVTLADTSYTGVNLTYYDADTNAAKLAGVIGEDALWDYSDLFGYGTSFDNEIIDLVESGFAGDFESATYVESSEMDFASFYWHEPDANQTLIEGFVTEQMGTEVKVIYDVDPFKSMAYPLTFGTNYIDTISGYAVLPLVGDVEMNGLADVKVDGVGTLKIAEETFENVLRLRTKEVISGEIITGEINILRESYAYYSIELSKLPIFIHVSFSAEVGIGEDISSARVYSFVELPLEEEDGGSSNLTEEQTIDIVPVVVANKVVKFNTSLTNQQIQIYDMMGNQVYSNQDLDGHTAIELGHLSSGTYVLTVPNSNEGIVKSYKISLY